MLKNLWFLHFCRTKPKLLTCPFRPFSSWRPSYFCVLSEYLQISTYSRVSFSTLCLLPPHMLFFLSGDTYILLPCSPIRLRCLLCYCLSEAYLRWSYLLLHCPHSNFYIILARTYKTTVSRGVSEFLEGWNRNRLKLHIFHIIFLALIMCQLPWKYSFTIFQLHKR